jgi:uncharacterized membrane protein
MSMELLHQVFNGLELIIDLSAAALMAVAFFVALFSYLKTVFTAEPSERLMLLQRVRCSLGLKLVFSLELLIVSDLLRTIVTHSLDDLLAVGLLVAVRTVISYFLTKEIEAVTADIAEHEMA